MKFKKRYIIIPVCIIVIIMLLIATIIIIDREKQKSQIKKDEKEYGNSYQKFTSLAYNQKPQRIIYKPKERDVFFIFDISDKNYEHLLEVAEDRMYYSVIEDFNMNDFTPDSIDKIMSSGKNYIIFDYNESSEQKPIIYKLKDNNRLKRLVNYLSEFRQSYKRGELGKDEFTYERVSGYTYMNPLEGD